MGEWVNESILVFIIKVLIRYFYGIYMRYVFFYLFGE